MPAGQAAPAGKTPARLPSEVVRAIVVRLAQFDRPAEVQAAVREEFERDVSLQLISYYDAERDRPELAGEWRELFAATRERFITETAGIAVAHRAVRLRRLGRIADAAEKRGNFELARRLREQAAKEVGDSFTNVHVLRSGDPAEHLGRMFGMPADEIRAAAAAMPALAPASPRAA